MPQKRQQTLQKILQSKNCSFREIRYLEETLMAEEKKEIQKPEEKKDDQKEKFQVSETWAQEIIEDMDDFIESQGIYLRQ